MGLKGRNFKGFRTKLSGNIEKTARKKAKPAFLRAVFDIDVTILADVN